MNQDASLRRRRPSRILVHCRRVAGSRPPPEPEEGVDDFGFRFVILFFVVADDFVVVRPLLAVGLDAGTFVVVEPFAVDDFEEATGFEFPAADFVVDTTTPWGSSLPLEFPGGGADTFTGLFGGVESLEGLALGSVVFELLDELSFSLSVGFDFAAAMAAELPAAEGESASFFCLATLLNLIFNVFFVFAAAVAESPEAAAAAVGSFGFFDGLGCGFGASADFRSLTRAFFMSRANLAIHLVGFSAWYLMALSKIASISFQKALGESYESILSETVFKSSGGPTNST